MTTAASSRPRIRVFDAVRPRPFRGELLAAGAVVLTVGVVLTDDRFDDGSWAAGVRFALLAVAAALVLSLAWLAPVEADVPRTYVSVLLVAGFVLAALALLALADALGGSSGSSGTLAWTGTLLAALFAFLAQARNSAICTLLAGATLVVAWLSLLDVVFSPDGTAAFRWFLLAAIVGLVAAVLRLRDSHRRHAVALVDVAGLATLLIGVFAVVGPILGAFAGAGSPLDAQPLAVGWELVLLVLGCGLIAYSAVDGEPGPGYLGAAVLAAFTLIAATGDSLLGWPLLLVALGAGVMAAALRPTKELPPGPEEGGAPAPTTPLARP